MPKTAKKRIVRKARKKPPAKRPLKFNLKIGRNDDPFWIHPDTIPNGVALQWVICSVDGEVCTKHLDGAIAGGWSRVPNQEEVNGLVLMWAPEEVARAQQTADIDRAKKQMAEVRELFQMESSREGRAFPLVTDSFMVSSDYDRVPSDADPIDVNVTIKMRINGHLQDAASFLKLTPEVYAQRRIDLYILGALGGIILPVGGAVELLEYGGFEIRSKTGARHV